MYRDVLVPLDGSTFSERALAHALPIARRSGAALHLFLVHEPIARYAVEIAPNRMIDRWEGQQRDRQSRYLEQRALALRAEGATVETEIHEGEAGGELTRRAASRVDLVIMSTHGRGGFERFWAGSVADTAVRDARAPVLLVPLSAAPPPAAGPGHIVAATDGSPAATAAVEEAVRLARLFDARLTLASVVTPGRGLPGRRVSSDPEARAHELLERTAAALPWPATLRVVRAARVAHGILAAREQAGGDLLAVGTHRRSRFARAVVGSVAAELVRASPVPLLVAHAPYHGR